VLFQRLVVDAQPLRHTEAVVAGHHIDVPHEPVDRCLPLLGLQVDGDAAFAAVERLKALALSRHHGTEVAVGVAGHGLDLDHLRAHV